MVETPPFSDISRAKQGCVLALFLLSIFFSMLLRVAFNTYSSGIPVVYRMDRNLLCPRPHRGVGIKR